MGPYGPGNLVRLPPSATCPQFTETVRYSYVYPRVTHTWGDYQNWTKFLVDLNALAQQPSWSALVPWMRYFFLLFSFSVGCYFSCYYFPCSFSYLHLPLLLFLPILLVPFLLLFLQLFPLFSFPLSSNSRLFRSLLLLILLFVSPTLLFFTFFRANFNMDRVIAQMALSSFASVWYVLKRWKKSSDEKLHFFVGKIKQSSSQGKSYKKFEWRKCCEKKVAKKS